MVDSISREARRVRAELRTRSLILRAQSFEALHTFCRSYQVFVYLFRGTFEIRPHQFEDFAPDTGLHFLDAFLLRLPFFAAGTQGGG
jgi:hypothetical protein